MKFKKKLIVILLGCIAIITLNGCGATEDKNTETTTQTSDSKNNEVVFYIARHGKTMFNATHRAQGWSDTPLIADGVTVAEQLGKGLKEVHFVEAYSSDSGRAIETANLVLKNSGQSDLELKESEDLREVCFGSFEGDTDENMWASAGKELGYNTYDDTMNAAIEGKITISEIVNSVKKLDTLGMAEDWNTVKERMQKELSKIADDVSSKGGGNVLITSHGMSIMSMLSDMSDIVPEGGQLGNASVTKVTYKNGEFTVNEVGNMDYVEKGASN